MARIESESVASDSDSGEEEQEEVWEAEEILKEKHGKVYVKWAGQDANGKPYPRTWEPRSNCNEALLAEWDAKQARRKALEERRKSAGASGSSKAPEKSRLPPAQKRKRDSLPATSAAARGSATKKIRRQTTDNILPSAGGFKPTVEGSAASVAPSKRLRKRSSTASSVPADVDVVELESEDSDDDVPISTVVQKPREAAAGAAQASVSDSKGEGKARETASDAVRPLMSGRSPSSEAMSQPTDEDASIFSTSVPPASHGAAEASVPAPASPTSQPSLAAASLPVPTSSGKQPASSRPPASPGAIFRRINEITKAAPRAPAAASLASAPSPAAPKAAFAHINRSTARASASAAPVPKASSSQQAAPNANASFAQERAADTELPSRPSAVKPGRTQGRPSKSPASALPANDDDDETMVEAALDPSKSAVPAVVAALPASLSAGEGSKPKPTLEAFASSASDGPAARRASSLVTAAGGKPRNSMLVVPPPADKDDDEAEDPEDQDVTALPGPDGTLDGGIRRPLSLKQVKERYLRVLEVNRELRAKDKHLQDQLDAQAAVAAEVDGLRAAVEKKTAALEHVQAARAADRVTLRKAEEELERLSRLTDVQERKLAEADATEAILRRLHDEASKAQQDKMREIVALEEKVETLQRQVSLGVAQVKQVYVAQIKAHDGVVDRLQAQLALATEQHQRTGDAVRGQAALVPGLTREIELLERKNAHLRVQLDEAYEDRDLAEAAVERLEDEKRARAVRAAYTVETDDSDDSDAEYHPPGGGAGGTPFPSSPAVAAAAAAATAAPAEEPSASSDAETDEDSPLSQLVRQQSTDALADVSAAAAAAAFAPTLYAPGGPLSASRSASPSSSSSSSSVVEIPLQAASPPALQAVSPHSVFGAAGPGAGDGLSGTLSPADVFPAGTGDLRLFEMGYGLAE